MQWHDLLGHSQQRDWFLTALKSQRLASTFLFLGPEGIGKKTFAKLLAKSLLCRRTRPAQLDHCGACEDCTQVDAGTHPDLLVVSKPAEKAYLPIELLIGERDKRMREGLCHEISMRPFGGRRRIAILTDADSLNIEGANCLLKTLEEPPPNSLLILVGTSLQRQLPTIRSRAQAIIFRPLQTEQVRQLLLRHQVVEHPAQAQELAMQSHGSLAEARLLADPELQQFQSSLLNMLSGSQYSIAELTKSCSAIVDAAGKDARAKRDRMKLLFRFAAAFYRALAIHQCANDASRNPGHDLVEISASQAARHWRRGSQGATQCWQRCLLAIEQVDRNANQASLLEAWSAEIAQMSGC